MYALQYWIYGVSIMDNHLKFHHPLVRFLHALLATLVVVQFSLCYSSEWIASLKPYKGFIFMLHKSTGNVAFLVVLLLIWAGWHYVRPNHLLHPVQLIVANIVKILLLTSVLLMSVSGYVMTSAGGYAYRFYGLFDMPLMIAPNKTLGGIAFVTHGVAATVLLILLGGHFLAAMYHHFIKKDNVLRSMYCSK